MRRRNRGSCHVKTRVGEQSAVVLPARVADEHGRVGLQTLQEIRTHFEPTGAAKRLHRGHAATLDGFAARAKNKALYGFVVSRDAIDGQIALCLGRFEQLALGCGHAGQHRQLAVVVEINTDAQIDLVRVAVGVELFVQTQVGSRGASSTVENKLAVADMRRVPNETKAIGDWVRTRRATQVLRFALKAE